MLTTRDAPIVEGKGYYQIQPATTADFDVLDLISFSPFPGEIFSPAPRFTVLLSAA